MPTKKRRVGFIPRVIVLDLINKLSVESNLSNSKIINILVEEALYKRGLFNIENENFGKIIEDHINLVRIENIKKEFNYKLSNNTKNYENIASREETLDNEIYTKFVMFLQFQERMKKESFE